jgi:hypothetical protein
MTLEVDCRESGRESSVFFPAAISDEVNARFLFRGIGACRDQLTVQIHKLLVIERDCRTTTGKPVFLTKLCYCVFRIAKLLAQFDNAVAEPARLKKQSHGGPSGTDSDECGLPGSFSCCGRTNRVAAKGHRDRRAHHFEQHTNASGGVKALEFADEISKRPGEYSD